MVVNANLARGAGGGREAGACCSTVLGSNTCRAIERCRRGKLPTHVTALCTAVAMARQQTIVKRLDAVQNLGAMDICCTDKTGTLTRDEVRRRICLRACVPECRWKNA